MLNLEKHFTIVNLADIDDCKNKPCKNGGQCEDGINSFSCHCPHGFIGEDCSISMFNHFRNITLAYWNYELYAELLLGKLVYVSESF